MRQADMQGSCLFVLFCFVTREECCFFSVLLMFTKETEGDMRAWTCILKLIGWSAKWIPWKHHSLKTRPESTVTRGLKCSTVRESDVLSHLSFVLCVRTNESIFVGFQKFSACVTQTLNAETLLQKMKTSAKAPSRQTLPSWSATHSRLRSLLYLPHCLLIFVYLYILY